MRSNDDDTLTWLVNEGRGAITRDGNLLVFVAVGLLAVSGAILNDWRWQKHELAGLPQVVDRAGRRFAYKRKPGGRFVVIYIPTGREVEHWITPLAAADETQLEAEVYAIISDNYPATT
jgi:hypothetical protein